MSSTSLSVSLTLPTLPAWRRGLRRSLGHRGLVLGSVTWPLIALAARSRPGSARTTRMRKK